MLSTASLCHRTIIFKKLGWLFYVNLDVVSVWGCEQGKGRILKICQVFKDPKQSKGFHLEIFKAFQDP